MNVVIQFLSSLLPSNCPWHHDHPLAIKLIHSLLSHLSISLVFHRVIRLSASICLSSLFSFQCVLMLSVNNVTVSSCLCGISLKCLFCSVFLYMLVCCFYMGGVCVLCVCVRVCVCLSLLFLIRSQQSVARWELSLSNFCLLIRLSLSPHMIHRTLPLSTLLNKPCRPPSQHAWDMTMISLPPFSFPF